MKKMLIALVPTAMLGLSHVAHADTTVPTSSFYLGAGATYNSVKVKDQDIYATGTSEVYSKQTGALTSSGSAGGPPLAFNLGSQDGFAPTLQAGYFSRFDNSKWLWGAKFSYNGFDISAKKNNFLIPQYGSFGATPFTGNAVVQEFKTTLSHQFSLIPYVGHAFDQGFIYAGAGPTLSRVQTKINNLVGFADVRGRPTDISGAPQNFSSSKWIWGATATVGTTYFFDSNWFVDANYSISMTPKKTAKYYSTYDNTQGGTDMRYTGSLIGDSTAKTFTQSVSLTINRAF